MTIGTSHFVSIKAAVSYYKEQGLSVSDVRRKVNASDIHIGPPVLKEGDILSLIDEGRRYAILETGKDSRRHAFVNSGQPEFDGNCAVCGGKDRDNIHRIVDAKEPVYAANICGVCHEPMLGSHYHESDE